ncbi:uncharacterized protein PG998_002984 [Apiospora kogelbergensis]|uniref:uncharacterized protein n=1 Tax=Apiospora kogelbergensis TaxID=1337665 RepID=UPI00312D6132
MGRYRMLVIDGYESHASAEFNAFCKRKDMITRAYGREIEGLMKSFVNRITKAEFLIAFLAAFLKGFTRENVQAGFSGADLVPLDPNRILAKLDVRLSTPSPHPATLLANTEWASDATQPDRGNFAV